MTAMKTESYLSFCRMSASLELDGPISISGMRSRVFMGEPSISGQSNIYSGNDCVSCTVLATAASTLSQNLKFKLLLRVDRLLHGCSLNVAT